MIFLKSIYRSSISSLKKEQKKLASETELLDNILYGQRECFGASGFPLPIPGAFPSRYPRDSGSFPVLCERQSLYLPRALSSLGMGTTQRQAQGICGPRSVAPPGGKGVL